MINSTTTTTTTTTTSKGYACDLCLKSFNRPSALRTHMYTHTGEKPHQCDIAGCGRRFAVISNLRRHLRVHQPIYVRRRLSSQERRGYVERLIQKSTGDVHFNTMSTTFETPYRLLKPKLATSNTPAAVRPFQLTLQHLLN